MSRKRTDRGLVTRWVDLLEDRYGRDILRGLERRAHRSSVDFAAAHLLDARVFYNRFSMLRYALSIAPKEGDILEFGVYRGKTINFLAKAAGPSRKVYGFDSFQGLPEDWKGKEPKGTFAVDQMPTVSPNVTLVPGWFDQTVPKFAQGLKSKPALVHIDSDLYSSSKIVLGHIGPLCGAGTVLVFDEFFNYLGWEQGEFRAFTEAQTAFGWRPRYVAYCSPAQQVAVQLE